LETGRLLTFYFPYFRYLIQAPYEKKGEWDVEYAPYGPGRGENKNYWVYNTEAHPFKVQAKQPV
jgi:mannosyl-oligosaccharide alpha-1,2-mannosidase